MKMSWFDNPSFQDDLLTFVCQVLPENSDFEAFIASLRTKCLKSKCKTPSSLYRQCLRWTVESPEARNILEAVRNANIDVFDLLGKADRATGGKPFPEYKPAGQIIIATLIDIMSDKEKEANGGPYLWLFDAAFFDTALKLWPLRLRHFPNGSPYLAKTLKGVTMPAHRFLIDKLNDDDDFGPRSSNWLDFSEKNFRVWTHSERQSHFESKMSQRYEWLHPAQVNNRYIGNMPSGDAGENVGNFD